MKVSNKWGVPNQFVIQADEGRYFQSYDSTVAFIANTGEVTLDSKTWDYLKTTGKYRNLFLGEDKKETEKKIKSGEYVLTDLNKQLLDVLPILLGGQ